MPEPYPLSYLHRDHRAVPRHLPPSPSPDLLAKQQAVPAKKPGAPKGKGAVRAKSGCYTCRIRRKKCDEQPDGSGSCQTCVRLRLECLGFGAKRPDWMRENNSVPELREKIKQFLASQGMIKGHSGSGARTSGDGSQGPILILSQDNSRSSSNTNIRSGSSTSSSPATSPRSPPSTTTTTSHHHHHGYPHVVTSAMRDAPAPRNPDLVPFSPLSPESDSYHSPANYTPQTYNSQSSLHNLLHPVDDMTFIPSYVPSHQHSESNGSSVSPTSQLHHHPLTPMTPIHTSSYLSQSSQQHAISNSRYYHPSPTQSHPPPQHQLLPRPESPVRQTYLKSNEDNETGGSSHTNRRSSQLAVVVQQTPIVPSSPIPPPPSSASISLSLQPLQSTLSSIYTRNFDDELDDGDLTPTSPPILERLPTQVPSSQADPVESHYIRYYLQEVLSRQYLLADSTAIANFLYVFSQTSETAKNAMCLLSCLHMHCMRQLQGQVDLANSAQDIHWFYRRVKDALSVSRVRQYNEGDAMAGLHVVSSFLFSGGRGPWAEYLDVAMDWVEAKLAQNPTNPAEVLLNATDSERFIIRTTLWFDVWASITQMRTPRFLDADRKLFGEAHSGAFIGDNNLDASPHLSMVNIIGCTNTSFRAMAEIATLANWKYEQSKNESLSIPQLVERGLQIERLWLSGSQQIDHHLFDTPDSQLAAESRIHMRRQVVSDVFKASARVYLHMVLSKAYPESPEIKGGVEETISYLRRIPSHDQNDSRAVVRSVIFAICICGCLTEDPEQKRFFLRRLADLGEEANVFGNCRAVKMLMEKVWSMRESSGRPVDWREVVTAEDDDNGALLLV